MILDEVMVEVDVVDGCCVGIIELDLQGRLIFLVDDADPFYIEGGRCFYL